jgi:hypothetical protein
MGRNSLFTQKVWKAPAVRRVRHTLSIKRAYRYLTARRRRLPDYIIAGAAKAGTTSLWAYLKEHPQVDAPITKEIAYFDVNFHRGIDWYRMHYPLAATREGVQTGEATPYYLYHPHAPRRIAQVTPRAKIVMLLRNPVDRAFSHYQLKVKRRQEPLTFEQAIEAEPQRLAGQVNQLLRDDRYYSQAHDRYSYLDRGHYAEQIERWQSFFPAEQILILDAADLFKRTAETYDQVLDFLGLPRWRPPVFGNRYPGEYQEKMSAATRLRLVEYFAPHNERLYQLLGRRFDWER